MSRAAASQAQTNLGRWHLVTEVSQVQAPLVPAGTCVQKYPPQSSQKYLWGRSSGQAESCPMSLPHGFSAGICVSSPRPEDVARGPHCWQPPAQVQGWQGGTCLLAFLAVRSEGPMSGCTWVGAWCQVRSAQIVRGQLGGLGFLWEAQICPGNRPPWENVPGEGGQHLSTLGVPVPQAQLGCCGMLLCCGGTQNSPKPHNMPPRPKQRPCRVVTCNTHRATQPLECLLVLVCSGEGGMQGAGDRSQGKKCPHSAPQHPFHHSGLPKPS